MERFWRFEQIIQIQSSQGYNDTLKLKNILIILRDMLAFL